MQLLFILLAGALFASVSAVETVCQLTSTTLYTQIYNTTIGAFPGAVFIVMAALLFLDIILLWYEYGVMLFFFFFQTFFCLLTNKKSK
jgi:hypothetical protein